MTKDELAAEVNRIFAGVHSIPQGKRLKWVKQELQKLPPEQREFVLQLVATTENLVEEDLNVKTSGKQITIGAVSLCIGAALAFGFSQPTGIQYLFIRGFFVLGFVGIAVGILVGSVNLKWSLAKSLIVTATGGFALLILIYYWNPPAPPNPGPGQPQTPVQTNSPVRP